MVRNDMKIDPKRLQKIFNDHSLDLDKERAIGILAAWTEHPWGESMTAQFCDSLKSGTALQDTISIMCCMWIEIGFLIAIDCPHCNTQHYPHCKEVQ